VVSAGEEKLRGPANRTGSHVVVGVAGGTFEGPKLKGTVIGPSGDSILSRPDGSSVLDLRMLLQTDDGEKIYMTCRGIAYTPKGGGLSADRGAKQCEWCHSGRGDQ
jgi:hypothetical protein